MDAFTTHTGIGVPLRRSNVDTDQIIPAVYLKRVTRTGFEDGLFSAWRNDPSYLKIETDEDVRVKHRGGRIHTFTEVENFGGGRVPPLNQGLTMAPECATAVDIAPGAGVSVSGLPAGNHRFQCCIHPWMRAIVKVKEDD